MLDDLHPYLTESKARDLLNKLEHRTRIDQALPAEFELALLWALSRLGPIDIEPMGENSTGPDTFSEALVPGQRVAVEIAAPNDNEISGEAAMDAVAQTFRTFANGIRKMSGDYLYFQFQVSSGYEKGRYYRRRLAPVDYKMSTETQAQMRAWITSGASGEIRVSENGLNVRITRTKHKQTRYFNIWSSMPPETHSLSGNPLYKLLVRKRSQLKSLPDGTRRFIFLGDAGSTLLRYIGTSGELDPTRRRVSGSEIITHFLNKYPGDVDAIVVFAPYRQTFPGRPVWKVNIFQGFAFDVTPLQRMVESLPPPRLEGYQVRSTYRQRGFDPTARGHWQATIRSWTPGVSMKIKVSSRALLDLLAGRATAEQFRIVTGEPQGKNIFLERLERGQTISKAHVESGGVDEDDNYLVLEFEDDAAARLFRLASERLKPS